MNTAATQQLQELLLQAMLADISAFKPGNVSYDSPGHGMDADMFSKSAYIVAPVLATAEGSLGSRILEAVTATRKELHCNTNLGIILLCAPLAEAMRRMGSCRNIAILRQTLAVVLSGLGSEDGVKLYAAIRAAAPGGLGSSNSYDVNSHDGGQIQAAMRHARYRDRIALQYCSSYHDVFTVAWPCLSIFHALWQDMAWALSACYTKLLCSFADSHIIRSHGQDAAEVVQGRACNLWRKLSPGGPPAGSELSPWHDLDSYCKQHRLNPGTTADLSVAGILIELWLVQEAVPGCRSGDADKFLISNGGKPQNGN